MISAPDLEDPTFSSREVRGRGVRREPGLSRADAAKRLARYARMMGVAVAGKCTRRVGSAGAGRACCSWVGGGY